jgi:hypothetical protein
MNAKEVDYSDLKAELDQLHGIGCGFLIAYYLNQEYIEVDLTLELLDSHRNKAKEIRNYLYKKYKFIRVITIYFSHNEHLWP